MGCKLDKKGTTHTLPTETENQNIHVLVFKDQMYGRSWVDHNLIPRHFWVEKAYKNRKVFKKEEQVLILEYSRSKGGNSIIYVTGCVLTWDLINKLKAPDLITIVFITTVWDIKQAIGIIQTSLKLIQIPLLYSYVDLKPSND